MELTDARVSVPLVGSDEWLSLARRARFLSWTSLAWLCIDGSAAVVVGVVAGWLGLAKRRIGSRIGSPATRAEGKQNLLCASLAVGLLIGLLGNALAGIWWLDPVVALVIAVACLQGGLQAWRGERCDGCC